MKTWRDLSERQLREMRGLVGDPRGEYLDGGARLPSNNVTVRAALHPECPPLSTTILIDEVIATARRRALEQAEAAILERRRQAAAAGGAP